MIDPSQLMEFPAMTLPRLMTRRQVARLLGVDISTLSRWEKDGCGPPCIRLEGQTIRYDLADALAYLAERKKTA